jgi:hypothetical protein
MDDINTGQYVVLECRHMFHEECFNRWILNEPSCPICRTISNVESTVTPVGAAPTARWADIVESPHDFYQVPLVQVQHAQASLFSIF